MVGTRAASRVTLATDDLGNRCAPRDGSAESTRLVFDLSAPVEAHAFPARRSRSDHRRSARDYFPHCSADRSARAGPERAWRGRPSARSDASGLVASYRFGLFAPGRSRIVIDLAAPARIVRRCEPSRGRQRPRGSSSNSRAPTASTFEAAARPRTRLGPSGQDAAAARPP